MMLAALAALAAMSAVVIAPSSLDRPASERWRTVPGQPSSRSHRRDNAVDAAAELPVFLDLVAAAAAGGMSGSLALASAARASGGPLGDVLSSAIAEGSIEGELLPAIRRVADETGFAELARLTTAMERSASLGTPLADAVRVIASDHRRERRRRAEQRARQAPVRMLFPLIFLVLPAFLLLTVVPMLLSTLGSLS